MIRGHGKYTQRSGAPRVAEEAGRLPPGLAERCGAIRPSALNGSGCPGLLGAPPRMGCDSVRGRGVSGRALIAAARWWGSQRSGAPRDAERTGADRPGPLNKAIAFFSRFPAQRQLPQGLRFSVRSPMMMMMMMTMMNPY